MIQITKSKLHWNYFIALEQDTERLSRYIEFCDQNLEVYSIELAHLLFAAASEVDVVAKALCELIDPTAPRNNIEHYRLLLTPRIASILTEEVYIPRFAMILRPWDNWATGTNPLWWGGYNNVKHHRDAHFHDANLKNALNSLGGLFVMVFYYYRERMRKDNGAMPTERDVTRELQPEASLLRLKDSYYYAHLIV
jgi:hypothetical protein